MAAAGAPIQTQAAAGAGASLTSTMARQSILLAAAAADPELVLWGKENLPLVAITSTLLLEAAGRKIKTVGLNCGVFTGMCLYSLWRQNEQEQKMATSEQDLMEAKRSIDKMLSRIPNRSESSFSTSYSVDIDELLSRLPNREDLSRNDNKFVRDWKESEHPRDKDGKFASEGGRISIKSLGESFEGYEGKAAVNKLIVVKNGYVPNAFYRKETGFIALVWGDENKGLCHIVKRRKEQGINIDVFLNKLPTAIEKGKIYPTDVFGKIKIKHNDCVVILDVIDGSKNKQFVLTAFEIY
jgi:hypothetical protein